jgi:hypothetical protein
MKAIFNILLSAALIMLGFGLVLSGLHAMPTVVSYQEVMPANVTVPVASATATPVPSVKVTATTVASGAPGVSAQLVSYGTDKDTYNRGDTANGYITLKNTGNSVINDVTVSVTVARSVPALGTASLGSKDYKINDLNIQPGETKKAEFSVNIPSEFSGFSTAGNYDVNGNVLVGGNQVGSFSKQIKVT